MIFKNKIIQSDYFNANGLSCACVSNNGFYNILNVNEMCVFIVESRVGLFPHNKKRKVTLLSENVI